MIVFLCWPPLLKLGHICTTQWYYTTPRCVHAFYYSQFSNATHYLWLSRSGWLGLWCLTPLSAIFPLYREGHWVLLVEEIGENHRPVASHWQTLSYNVVSTEYISPWTGFELTTLVVAQVVVNPTSMRARPRLPLSRQTQHILFFETQYLNNNKKKNSGRACKL